MSVEAHRKKNKKKEQQTTMYKSQSRAHITESVSLHKQKKQMLMCDQSTSMQDISPEFPLSQKLRDRPCSPLT